MSVTVNVTCDENYSPYAKVFIASMNCNSPGANIVVRAVNCKEDTIKKIEQCGNNVSVITDNTRLSTRRNILSHGQELVYDGLFESIKAVNKTAVRSPKLLCSEQMAYCSNIKFKTINDLLSEMFVNDLIIYMDIDTIVRGPLDGLYEQSMTGDLAMFKDVPYTEQHPGSNRLQGNEVLYHGGLICVNNNDKTRELFADWVKIVNNDMTNWDVDEDLFYTAHNRSDISIVCLQETYKDENLNDRSLVWSGAGQTKFTQDKYIQECKKYDREFR